MRSIGILSSFVLLMCLTVPALSGHSSGNGTCTDEFIHYQNFEAKRSDAPLFTESQQWRDKAVEMRVTGNTTKCEEYLLEAIRMLKKTDGEYPTE
tara:strand:+ start:605 stop:889 length:285 start_codon:yes stop_codon:yes gene_type:complete